MEIKFTRYYTYMKYQLLLLLSGLFFMSATITAAENISLITTELSIVSVPEYAWSFCCYKQVEEKEKLRYNKFIAKTNEYKKEIDKLNSLKKNPVSSNIEEIDNKIIDLKHKLRFAELTYKNGLEEDRKILQKWCYLEMADIASKMRYNFVIDSTITCQSSYGYMCKVFPFVSEKLNRKREVLELIKAINETR